ncbi:MAG: hypothetical protein QXK24_00155 [Ignisphaera sp.]
MNIKKLILKYKILEYPNVVGYSNKLQNRIKQGQVLEEKVIRIYVSKKVPAEQLKLEEIIPRVLKDGNSTIETDVVEIGEIKALSVSKTSRVRPVPLGVSVGNWNITAGSLGMLYKYKGQVIAGTNAHVVTDTPNKSPKDVVEKRILQPGSYHGGQKEENIVGYYLWHKRIVPVTENECKVAKVIVKVLNFLTKILRRKGRFYYFGLTSNKIDFGVYTPTVEHTKEVMDGSLKDEKFIGHLFAGSYTTGVICKAKYIIKEGYCPLIEPAEVKEGDIVRGSSFWCNYTTKVIDSSGNVMVGYGNFNAWFEDVILVSHDGTIKGGWSGSGWRKVQ